jgi:hypothetical protein
MRTVSAFKNGKFSINAAARNYGIRRKILRRRIDQKETTFIFELNVHIFEG